jgi:hypothetical protein
LWPSDPLYARKTALGSHRFELARQRLAKFRAGLSPNRAQRIPKFLPQSFFRRWFFREKTGKKISAATYWGFHLSSCLLEENFAGSESRQIEKLAFGEKH